MYMYSVLVQEVEKILPHRTTSTFRCLWPPVSKREAGESGQGEPLLWDPWRDGQVTGQNGALLELAGRGRRSTSHERLVSEWKGWAAACPVPCSAARGCLCVSVSLVLRSSASTPASANPETVSWCPTLLFGSFRWEECGSVAGCVQLTGRQIGKGVLIKVAQM